MKVVFDTNVFISAVIVPGGQAERALLLAWARHFILFTSVPILTETAQKLRSKFGQTDKDIRQALKFISRVAEILKPKARLRIFKDIPDNRILECAFEARADLIITGDGHLLRLREFEGTSIIRLADFLRLFPEAVK